MQKDILSPLKSFDNNYAYLKVDKKKPSTWLLEQEPEIFKELIHLNIILKDLEV